jgi:signal peptidase I
LRDRQNALKLLPMTEPNPSHAAPPARKWLHLVAIGRNPKMTCLRIATLVVACFVVFNFVLLPIRVTGISMLPTYKNHSINFINRLAYLWHEPQRGDVVGIRYAGIHVMLLKRIVGLPGETVAFVHGHIFIDGRRLKEPYEKLPCDWNLPPENLSTNEFFVVGDNRSMPPEDHTFGRVERNRIVGKVLL